MDHRNRIVAAALVLALLMTAGWIAVHRGESHSGPAREILIASSDPTLAEAIERRDREIARLRAENSRMEELLEQKRTPALATTEVEAIAVAPADLLPNRDRVEAARALLQSLLPERYGSLTVEQTAALANVDLHGCKATDADLAVLVGLPALESLSLRGTEVTDAGMAALANAASLTSIDLRATKITGTGLAALPLSRLTALHLTDTKIGSDDLHWMPAMPDLATLKLNRLRVGDDALRRLPYSPNLVHLEVDGTQITSDGLRETLRTHPALNCIELRGCPVDDEAVAALRSDFPQVTFVNDPGRAPFR